MLNIADLRQNYTRNGLLEADVLSDPFLQFKKWFDEAVQVACYEPNAMTLATTNEDGKPSARIVLLKGFDENGFVFYTNYESQKSQDIEENPHAALLFFWSDLERQVRIEGSVEKTSREESDAYFASRPFGSKVGAWVSDQSRVIKNRTVLEVQQADLEARYTDGNVPRPPHWGGWRVKPAMFEFWQGRPSRLHDRIYFSLQSDDSWKMERLAP